MSNAHASRTFDQKSLSGATPYEFRDPAAIPPRPEDQRAEHDPEHGAVACDDELDADGIIAHFATTKMQEIVAKRGGEIRGGQYYGPAPGYGPEDRKLEVRFDPNRKAWGGWRVINGHTAGADNSQLRAHFDLFDEMGWAPPDGIARPANDNEPGGKPPRPKFQLTWFCDIAESEPKEQVIKGVFGVGEFSTIVGKPETGKSVITTDMACHIAAGLDWHGRPVKQGLVVYVAAERRKLTERRLSAFRKHHGIEDIPLVVVGGSLDMTGGLDDARALVEAIDDAESRCGFPCVLLVIDTLSRTFGGGDQHHPKDMGRYVQAVDAMLESLPQAHIAVIHHSPWNEDRGKGAIDLKGATDASFATTKGASLFHFKCTGANDAEEGPITSFRLEAVQVGTDEDGEPTMAPVVVQADDEIGDKLAAKVRGINAAALRALQDAVATEGIPPDGPGFPDGVLVVTEETWRARFYADAPDGITSDTLSKRFRRAKQSLEKTSSVRQIGEWIWPA